MSAVETGKETVSGDVATESLVPEEETIEEVPERVLEHLTIEERKCELGSLEKLELDVKKERKEAQEVPSSSLTKTDVDGGKLQESSESTTVPKTSRRTRKNRPLLDWDPMTAEEVKGTVFETMRDDQFDMIDFSRLKELFGLDAVSRGSDEHGAASGSRDEQQEE